MFWTFSSSSNKKDPDISQTGKKPDKLSPEWGVSVPGGQKISGTTTVPLVSLLRPPGGPGLGKDGRNPSAPAEVVHAA